MKKKLLTALVLTVSAALLVAASVMGTIAFLASSSAVSNTFTYGEVGIEMRESAVDANGKDNDGADRTTDGNSYLLVPNKAYDKDPAIFVKEASQPSYLFVKIKNGISTIEKKNGNTMKNQMIANGWQCVKTNAAGEELYLYVGVGNANDKVENGAVQYVPVGSANPEVYEIFKTFEISDDAAVADFAGAKVTLTAFAIQTEGFTAEKDGLQGYQQAWNAIVGRFPYESGTLYTANTTPGATESVTP